MGRKSIFGRRILARLLDSSVWCVPLVVDMYSQGSILKRRVISKVVVVVIVEESNSPWPMGLGASVVSPHPGQVVVVIVVVAVMSKAKDMV
jgi:hypothetical protein